MGLFDVLRGRSAPKAARLDSLFSVPTAAITLQTALGFNPTGHGSVCFRAAEGGASASTQADAVALIQADGGPQVHSSEDSFGFTWLVVDGSPDDVEGLVTDLHAVNSGMETQGFSTGLLCSLVGFTDGAGRKLGLVYLYKQGTFYPFCPTGPQSHDGLLERQVRDTVSGDVPIEQDPARWLPVWGAPGL